MNTMYHLTSERKKVKYGGFSNFIYFLKGVKEWDKKLFYFQFLLGVASLIAFLFETALPSVLVSSLEQHLEIGTILLQLGLFSLGMWVFHCINEAIYNYNYEQYSFLPLLYMKKYTQKIMQVDYEMLDEPHFKHISENTWSAARNGRGISNALTLFPYMIADVLVVLVYGWMLARQSIWLIVVIFLSVTGSLFLLSVARKKHRQYFGTISKYAKREEYISIQSMDSAAGKDIRIYRMLDWFLKKYDESLETIAEQYHKIHIWYLFRNGVSAVLEFVRDGLAYGLLVYFLMEGRIDAAGFVFSIGVVGRFSTHLDNFFRGIMGFQTVNTSIGYIREFMETEEEWSKVEGVGADKMEKLRKTPVTIELRDVSFTYPGKEEPTLSHIHLTIHPGEKLALIGLNGAGKTTLVKLICGFYQPTEGEILVNGISIREYSREEYYSLIAVLFQDETLLPVTLDENIMGQCAEAADNERLQTALRLSGFQSKYESLTRKGQSRLIKKLNEDAVDFSGGEKQKLLFARAIYKNAPLTILDEPTAALDPIAENELYQHFGEAMEGKTSVYISHRLSSTRFCDRIVLLEHGRILEEGTHENLLAAGKRYTQLYEMQSQYYRDQEKRKKRSSIMGDEYIQDGTAERGIFHE